ncbi:hypothetical protein [Kutzneria chonburiensis]|uniref:Uncharacterized protein n=1 Tax=Kutzneria chonburiensis TaxID=1483604 RepID=A0ABV6MUQ3_9PSEU|nr:hypothetical protein [Kutzneria chonburiensis]
MSDSHGYHIRMASEEVLAQREQLVQRILAELTMAGLPAQRSSDDAGWGVGAVVTADRLHDTDGGGVFVQWEPSVELNNAVVEAAEAGRPLDKDPASVHACAVSMFMQTALVGILCSVGLRAYDPRNHYDPCSVKVELPA